jgi:hypothetical protein
VLDPPFSGAVDSLGRLRSATTLATEEALVRIGLAARTIAGVRVSDQQMLWPVTHLLPALLEKVCAAQPRSNMQEWLAPLLSLGAMPDQILYITRHWSELQDPAQLFQHLKSCYANPSAISPLFISKASKSIWLYHLLMEWIKIAGKTKTAFGASRLLADLTELASDPTHQAQVERIVGEKVTWRHVETIRLGLLDWHSRASKQGFPLRDDDLARVADALARRLKKCREPDPAKDVVQVTNATIQINLEVKLLTYRHLQPVRAAIEIALSEAHIPFGDLTYLGACFAQYAKAQGTKLDPRSAGTTVIKGSNTLINWQSAHDSHTNDKKKELCGRAVALRYVWDESSKKFVPRPGVDRLILVVDGTWRQEDLDSLARAGWDHLFYPDQMDGLVQAIV